VPTSATYARQTFDYSTDPPTLVYDGPSFTRTNANVVKKNANDVESYGGRAALKIAVNDRWTITPTLLYQHQNANGDFAFDPRLGDLNVGDYTPGKNDDSWYQSALTVEGKIGNFDLMYSGGYFERKVDNVVDYAEYASPTINSAPGTRAGMMAPADCLILRNTRPITTSTPSSTRSCASLRRRRTA